MVCRFLFGTTLSKKLSVSEYYRERIRKIPLPIFGKIGKEQENLFLKQSEQGTSF